MPGPVPISARDFGGTGTPVVLLHGLGGSKDTWSAFAPMLTSRHRVIALDLRGHGDSGDAPWDWEGAIGDIARVVSHFALERPAVVGMSLGGGLAVLWGESHPRCPGVVNIDGGHRHISDPSQYSDTTGLDELNALFDAQAHQVERPGPEILRALRRGLADADLLARYEELRCPCLVLSATRGMPGMDAFENLGAVYRDGLNRELAEVANPRVEVVEFPGSHAMLFENPSEIAARVLAFLR
ncbi:alpha/beta fold hydrolase [Allokutzneria albata]|uniref:Pimeloyl-ACP methyl ester carboxylesterase n=1 Tax=Allokutzneria albata TaxID=211114 RepID=A0A1G9ZL50_ALLAB|nr:alpha/beta hydrolase [Allokutzneria albata]SDN21805.1 Pimeloyl-ACP methyl ester carboxylesterase [Allokutzneria albata]